MTDKEFKKLSRSDLIRIIFEMQKNEQKLSLELENTKKALADKNLKISESGSIAEAVVGLNGIFENAQKAADDYLEQIRNSNINCENLIKEAEQEAASIKDKARKEADLIIGEADKVIAEKWDNFNKDVNSVLKAHEELKELLKKDII